MIRNTILITGADGFLGGKITKRILEKTTYNVLGLTMSEKLVETALRREGLEISDRLQYIENDVFLSSDQDGWGLAGAIHLAFSRRMQPAADIASSIVFAASIFHKLAGYDVDRVIYMSSQGIYGNTEEIRTEKTAPAPATQYTMAKYAAEVLFLDIMRNCPHHTALRLDPVAQSQNVLRGLCKSAKDGKIQLKGGKQVFSFIDAEDVPDAVLSMINTEGEWEHVYNVGWNRTRYTLVELAEMIADEAVHSGYDRPDIVLEESDLALWAGMNSERFMERTGWKPEIEIRETIREMLN